MANSKYEYVKSFEVEDEIMLPNIIIVRVDGRDFRRFSEVHEFEKPNDKKALELLNECAKAVLEQFPDIIFSYGFSDEYSFGTNERVDLIFKEFSRQASYVAETSDKISISIIMLLMNQDTLLIVSFFTSCYVTKWKALFPQKDLRYAPSLRSRVICCASVEVLQAYLVWRQYECHLNNQYDTCLWKLIQSGKSQKEAEEILKGSQKQDRNELLYQCFNINYKKDIPEIFRQGTCTLKTEVEDIVKYKDDGCPVKRLRRKVITVHSENIASRRFWNDQLCLPKELGPFTEDLNKTMPEYLKSFQYENKLMPCTWIVIRIDGCHFHRFSEVHEFEKPNDAQALNLMNSCAAGVLEEFRDIVFAYGVSDEYSFVLKKESQLYRRHTSEIVSAVVSFFSSMYAMKWNEFFPHKEMKYPPYFDGRAVCYPSCEILLDYLAWRQVDCHINNQYNSCFWMLVKSGKSKSAAQQYLKGFCFLKLGDGVIRYKMALWILKEDIQDEPFENEGTQAQEKNELLDQLSGTIDYYNKLPLMFRQGSSVYWDKVISFLLSHPTTKSIT
ncbi:tRNA(His) guanylyltransferase 1 [Sesamum angolense]|uniref:tRNA(His) guanylyltransferase n=1 Tax=Sesamum angolense TaxID=2727404 RepID=A0AAE1WJ66_9LAMI|nr:tRNA(His) guanylyltransferase 1 [Sesamum angolense]